MSWRNPTSHTNVLVVGDERLLRRRNEQNLSSTAGLMSFALKPCRSRKQLSFATRAIWFLMLPGA